MSDINSQEQLWHIINKISFANMQRGLPGQFQFYLRLRHVIDEMWDTLLRDYPSVSIDPQAFERDLENRVANAFFQTAMPNNQFNSDVDSFNWEANSTWPETGPTVELAQSESPFDQWIDSGTAFAEICDHLFDDE